MKLCADILYWRLKEELKTVELHGAGSLELTLSRPEFYLDRTQTFEKNRVYVCSADHLPARPSLRENVCLVCLGQHWNLAAFYDRCSVIVVEADTDIFRVFNLVQRIFEPSWEKRTEAICDIANMMNMAVAGTPEEQKDYVNASLYEAFNIPELCEKSSWLGGITGDSGDEWENMAGRVVQFTRNRVEKELDTCPWDIVGSELCNMTTSMFTANFDLASSKGTENEVALNMCQARGCGNKHCRVVAERRDVYNLPKQGWLDHMQQPVDPIHDTPRERMVKEGQCLRNGQYTQNFGEETSLEKAYHWVAQMGWVWSIQFPMMAIKDMAPDEDEFLRVFRIVFATAGKNQFIDPFAKEGLRSYLGVPHEMDENDGRILGGYIRYMLDVQQVPYEMVRWTKDETWIKVKSEDFTARYEMAPLDELVDAYEAQWNGAAKTLVSPEWSCVIEDRDEEDMLIKVIRKEDLRML